jgi:hypothetical protein
MYLTSHRPTIFIIMVSPSILKLYLGEIKGKMYKLMIIYSLIRQMTLIRVMGRFHDYRNSVIDSGF